ncbi:aldehyde dehydrogenase family protein [Parasphingorhabdus sp.]|uniref:aldehyde dehydrogenase family protein n=1 Tax=Parasphingorhabdus sp. TaxID=2709688 RepID=UPI0032630453
MSVNINPMAAPSPQAKTLKFLEANHELLIDGKWQKAQDGATLDVVDPATGKPLATVACGGAADVDIAVTAARRAFEGEWSTKCGFDRAEILRKLARIVEEHSETLAELDTVDNGMPIMLARMIVGNTSSLFNYYAGWAERIEGTTTTPPSMILAEAEAFTYTLKEPVGVVGMVLPWNVPLSMAALKLGPALAAGCTVVLKPAEDTPLATLYLGHLLEEAGIPPGVVNIIPGLGHTAGAALAAHDDVDKIAFTGSTAVGGEIARAATGNFKKVSLELGGKSPVVVFADADIDLVVPGIAQAGFFLQGQNCMAGTRIFLEDSIHDEVIERLVAHVKTLKIGNGLDPETQIGPLITAKHRERVFAYIEAGLAEGATLAVGGDKIDGPGNFLSPTIFTDTTPDMKIVREEIFGPVIAVQRFKADDLEEVARQANDSIYGLSGSVWTRDLSLAHKMARRIRSGHVSVNCHGAVGPNIPFGGYRQSGWGREFGREGLELFLETKAVTVRL